MTRGKTPGRLDWARRYDIFRPDRLRAIVSEDEAQIDHELFVLASLEIWMRANVGTVSKYQSLFDELVADHLPAPRCERTLVRAHGNDCRSRLTHMDIGRVHELQSPVVRSGLAGARDSACAERRK
jgi:hypothetical protein